MIKINKNIIFSILPSTGLISSIIFAIITCVHYNQAISLLCSFLTITAISLTTFFFYKYKHQLSTLKKENTGLARQRSRQLRELDMARQIQQSLLTHKSMITPEIKIVAHSRPAEKIGGDFYTLSEGISCSTATNAATKGIIQLTSKSQRHATICIGDVAGHGVASALIMLLAQAMIERLINRIPSPAKVLQIANKEIKEQTEQSEISFVTAAILQIDLDSLKLSFAKAGHTDSILIHKDGSTELLASDGVFLGMFDTPQYEEKELFLKHGDRILCYTDGITEAKAKDGELYGVSRLKEFLVQNLDVRIEDLIKKIYNEIEIYSESNQVNDDATIVLIEVL